MYFGSTLIPNWESIEFQSGGLDWEPPSPKLLTSIFQTEANPLLVELDADSPAGPAGPVGPAVPQTGVDGAARVFGVVVTFDLSSP